MGSAISAFYNATAVRVPRTRFAPVKTTNDLLLVMSDCYVRTGDETISPNPERTTPMPQIKLDPRFYKNIEAFLARFPHGAPSLLHCDSLEIEGDILFEGGVTLKGNVRLSTSKPGQGRIAPGATIEGEHILS
jgi:UTP--glucose-1-phosphate uridylyltransferase